MVESSQKVKLYLFTAKFPSGNGETFISEELKQLSQKVDEVKIFPVTLTNKLREIPSNAIVVSPSSPQSFTTYSEFFIILKILWVEFFNCKSKLFFIKKIKHWVSSILDAYKHLEHIKANTEKTGNIIFYSFWLNKWALALAIGKEKGLINEFYIRSNGFDIFDERWEGNYLPFRKYVYGKVKQVHINTRKGVEYVKAKNIFPEKILLSYLGTKDFGFNKKNFDPTLKFTVVSCSRLVKLKRVHLIAEILKFIPFEVSWIHIGSGEELETVRASTVKLPSNISVELKSRFDTHGGLITFFKESNINLFINVSETEGLPVIIQEAMSFGIPCLATDVGGTSEVVNSRTGILIAKDFNPEEVAQKIIKFKHSEKNTPEFRMQIRKFWENNFRVEDVTTSFFKKITA